MIQPPSTSTAPTTKCQAGFSLLEMTAVIAILAVVATLILTRVSDSNDKANIAACQVYKGNIEIQTQLWRQNTGSWPAVNLSNIGANLGYFPEGLPTCPVDGSPYTISASTGHVVGHSH